MIMIRVTRISRLSQSLEPGNVTALRLVFVWIRKVAPMACKSIFIDYLIESHLDEKNLENMRPTCKEQKIQLDHHKVTASHHDVKQKVAKKDCAP